MARIAAVAYSRNRPSGYECLIRETWKQTLGHNAMNALINQFRRGTPYIWVTMSYKTSSDDTIWIRTETLRPDENIKSIRDNLSSKGKIILLELPQGPYKEESMLVDEDDEQ